MLEECTRFGVLCFYFGFYWKAYFMSASLTLLRKQQTHQFSFQGSRQLETSETSSMGQSRGFLSILRPTQVKIPAQKSDALNPSETIHMFAADPSPRSNSWNEVSSIAFVVALLCGLMISYVIHRLVKAEEKQQLAMLYENVEIPLLEEKDSSEDESSQLDPENEELGKFIGSVIKTKIMENIKKKMKEEQNVLKGNTSENFSCIEKVETHEKLDKDGNSGNL
ncbi:uncharacterized protein C19orf18 homolog isoform X2 [Rattus norvegicus]|uniref:uncharacterized protein C19orf18 homolog isoform X2 n=2 Tax=Rattus norvegicus TaxID=10116 RepID=UPI002FD7D6AF